MVVVEKPTPGAPDPEATFLVVAAGWGAPTIPIPPAINFLAQILSCAYCTRN